MGADICVPVFRDNASQKDPRFASVIEYLIGGFPM